MKKLVLTAVFAISASCIHAADEINFDNPGANANALLTAVSFKNETPKPMPVKTSSETDWTIMVYMNAKNNLANAAVDDINEMEAAGLPAPIKAVVEVGYQKYHPTDGTDSEKRADPPTPGTYTYSVQRLEIHPDMTSMINSPVLEDISGADMGDWKHLADFVAWAKERYPAKNYMLIVWNHGNGWRAPMMAPIRNRGISFDDETKHAISTPGLGKALSMMGQIDVLAFDACLMQMAEVAYEVKDFTPFIVGSEEVVPTPGFNYDFLFRKLSNLKRMPLPVEAAAFTVQAYADYYVTVKGEVTMSAVSGKALGQLSFLANNWVRAVINANETEVMKNARNNAQRYFDKESKDFFHFVQLVRANTKNSAVAVASEALLNYLGHDAIILNAHLGPSYVNSYGLAVYVPYEYNPRYENLAFSKDTAWHEFAKYMAAIPAN